MYGNLVFIFLWSALSLGVVGFAYLSSKVELFGKQSNGSMNLLSVVVLLPYFLCVWGAWHLLRFLRNESAYDELLPNIFIGRRLLPRELPPTVTMLLDLTCEFPEPARLRKGRSYLSLPILDSSVPKLVDLTKTLNVLAKHQGTIYIHCAEGHGRTGLVASAFLLHSGFVHDAEAAVKMVKDKRPRVQLCSKQLEMLGVIERSFK
jgi:protein-tyrosine phosphatase